jgi:Pyridoxamine 5'-phosphate oxidase
MTEDLVALGRSIVEGNDYLTLATADAAGTPWATPVWFAHASYTSFVWISRPTARHSQNIAARREVGIVIFDSTVRPGEGTGVYLDAIAGPVDDADLERHLATYSARSVVRTGTPWTLDDATKPGGLRLYVAEATAEWVLDDHDRRIPLRL